MLRKMLRLTLVSTMFGLAACTSATPDPTQPPIAVTVYRAGTPTPTNGAVIPPPATPQPGSTAVPHYGPDSFPENVNPLTGEIVDPAQLSRMPIAVKISNFPYNVRPQSGLSLADLVFEHLAEAGLTRFTAIYLQNDVARLGSIRSARYIDNELAPMFGAMLVTSGSSLGTMSHLRSSTWFYGDNVWRLVSEETHYVCPPLCRADPEDSNTLFASTTDLRAATAAQGSDQRADLSGFEFTAEAPPGGAPVTEVYVDLSSAAKVDWRYNAGSGRYDRWQDKDSSGALIAHFDALTNQPISAANVVVLFVNQLNNYVPEDFRDGGNCGLEMQLWSTGPALVFRDGQMWEGHWVRDATTNWHMQIRNNQAGQVLPFKPGNTWFDVVTLNAGHALAGATYTITNRVPDTKYSCPIPPTETPTVTPEGYIAPTETPTP